MFGGGGGLNPRKMKQMMEQMGIDMADIDAEEVIIRTDDEELHFSDADVQLMEAQGQKTYHVVGDPETRKRTDDEGATETTGESDDPVDVTDSTDSTGENAIPDDDVDLVATRAGVDDASAREALIESDGDLAAAIERLE